MGGRLCDAIAGCYEAALDAKKHVTQPRLAEDVEVRELPAIGVGNAKAVKQQRNDLGGLLCYELWCWLDVVCLLLQRLCKSLPDPFWCRKNRKAAQVRCRVACNTA